MASHLSTCRTIYLSVSLFILISIYLWAHFSFHSLHICRAVCLFFVHILLCLSLIFSSEQEAFSSFPDYTENAFATLDFISWTLWKKTANHATFITRVERKLTAFRTLRTLLNTFLVRATRSFLISPRKKQTMLSRKTGEFILYL